MMTKIKQALSFILGGGYFLSLQHFIQKLGTLDSEKTSASFFFLTIPTFIITIIGSLLIIFVVVDFLVTHWKED